MTVRKLPEILINQIAAGEVVERPASVVRELVDNALDAGALDIRVFLEQGGQSLIRVLDNGCGMSPSDAKEAFTRHATSKIASLEDLEAVRSLGFRGEALPSIASVSEVRLRTRTSDAPIATELLVLGGEFSSVREVAAPVGTDIEVRKLFFNTPARRKFLRQPKTEDAKIKAWIAHTSMAWPAVRFTLTIDGHEALSLAPRESTIERARQVVKGGAVAFSRPGPTMSVEGFLAHPSMAGSDGAVLTILVNRRVISDRMLLRAIKDGFDSTLKDREVPRGVVRIDIDPREVDVNVHPQKSEVRFRDSQGVFAAVRAAVREAVMTFTRPMPMAAPELRAPFMQRGSAGLDVVAGGTSLATQAVRESAPQYHQTVVPFPAPQIAQMHRAEAQDSAPLWSAALGSEAPFRYQGLRYIGMLLQCYLLCERDEEFVLVDMHAAHERVNFNLIRHQLKARDVVSQQLLVPLRVSVGEEGLQRLMNHRDQLLRRGLELEEFGDDSVTVRAAPSLLVGKGGAVIERLIREIAASELSVEAGGRFDEWVDSCAARLACHASVRSGDALTPREVAELFRELDNAELSAACPHGRPVVVSFCRDQVERWFGRDR